MFHLLLLESGFLTSIIRYNTHSSFKISENPEKSPAFF